MKKIMKNQVFWQVVQKYYLSVNYKMTNEESTVI